MLKKTSIFLLIFLSSCFLFSDAPVDYYDGTEGLSGEALKTALHNIIDGHTEFSYDNAWEILSDVDEDPENSNNVILIHTGWSLPKSQHGGAVDEWNREHVWAKSHGGFGESRPAGSDVHNLHPSDATVNSARGSLDYDNGGSEWIDGNGATGCYRDSDSWETRDGAKGDVARTIFYMATRYEGDDTSFDLELDDDVNNSTTPYHGKLSTLLQWHIDDPVDDFERNRNDKIYENWQGNRNPFIDHPEFVALIWGGEIPEDTTPPTITEAFVVDINTVVVDFSEFVDQTISENESNYNIDNGIGNPITATRGYEGNNSKVVLEVSALSANVNYTITINNIEDLSENVIVANSQTSFTFQILTTIINDSFESSDSGWSSFDNGSTFNWERVIPSGSSQPSTVPDGSYCMYMNNYNGNESADDWFISPALDLSSSLNTELSFEAWTKYSDDQTDLEVLVSTDYSGSGDPETSRATWTNLSVSLPSENSYNWQTVENVDLSLYDGNSSVYIAFHYTCTGTTAGETQAWSIDDVLITGEESSTLNAGFSATPLSGLAPLVVNFTDNSTGSPTQWFWDFDNDGTNDSTEQNPQHEYTEVGVYSVKLTVHNAAGEDIVIRNNYITVETLGDPVNFQIVRDGNNVQLSWNAVTEADGYRVYASDFPDRDFTDVTYLGQFSPFSNNPVWSSSNFTESKKFFYVQAYIE